jgi:DNA-directed RNA polymerase subunit RPC12/RpoP
MTADYECPHCGYEKELTLTLPESSRQRKCPDCGELILLKPIEQIRLWPLKRKSKKK